MNTIGEELGLGFAGIGYEPKWPERKGHIWSKVVIVNFSTDYLSQHIVALQFA